MNETLQERLDQRLSELRECKNAEEMAFVIWSKGLEEATGSSKKGYRDGFIDWVEGFKSKQPTKWKYKSPEELADSIWEPFLDEPNDIWFPSLRKELINWINRYCNE